MGDGHRAATRFELNLYWQVVRGQVIVPLVITRGGPTSAIESSKEKQSRQLKLKAEEGELTATQLGFLDPAFSGWEVLLHYCVLLNHSTEVEVLICIIQLLCCLHVSTALWLACVVAGDGKHTSSTPVQGTYAASTAAKRRAADRLGTNA